MNDTTLDDLKELITGRFDVIDTQLAEHSANFDTINTQLTEHTARFDDNEVVMNEILDAVGGTQASQGKAIHIQADHIDNHEHRITKLEKRTV